MLARLSFCEMTQNVPPLSPARILLNVSFLCACLDPDNSVQSVVSFDQGGEWVPLQKPANSKCDATAKDPDKVDENKTRQKIKVWRGKILDRKYFF